MLPGPNHQIEGMAGAPRVGGVPAAKRLLAGVVLMLLVMVPAWSLIGAGLLRGRAAHDQLNYHEPTIIRFAAQWPEPDISDYLSATAPGYHLALTVATKVFGSDRQTLQILGSLFTAGLFFLLGWATSNWVGAAKAVVLCLPLACSMYFLYPGVWLLPDNAGWLGVAAVLWLALVAPARPRTWVILGVVLVALVFVRQIHLWAAAVAWTAALLGSPDSERALERRWDVPGLFRDVREGWGRAALMLLASVPAFLLIAWLMRAWNGLTPPFFQASYHGGNPAAPAFILALFGLFSPFFVIFAWPMLSGSLMSCRRGILAGVVIGLILAAVSPTVLSAEAGRYSGLWNYTRRVPEIGGRSILITGLAALGGGLLMMFLGALPRRDRRVLAAAIVGFAAAQSASHEVWQRYNEPFVLLTLAWMAARTGWGGHRSAQPQWRRARLAGPIALAALLALGTAFSLVHGRKIRDRGFYRLPAFETAGWSIPVEAINQFDTTAPP